MVRVFVVLVEVRVSVVLVKVVVEAGSGKAASITR